MPTPWPKPAPRIVKRAFAAKAGEDEQRDRPPGVMTRRGAARPFRVARHGAPGRSCGRLEETWASARRRICSWSASRPRASGTCSASRARRRSTSTSRSTRSSIEFVPVRHEQGGAYMADMYGRLTQLGRRLPRHARTGRDEPRDRRRRRLPRPLADGRADRPGRPRADAQGVAPVHRRGRHAAAGHEVQRAAELGARDPGGRAQGVQGRRRRRSRGRPTSSCPRT